jgi:tRNA(fMet)-specific endonuclease VapC
VLAELYAGAYLLDDPSRILAAVDDLRRDVGVLVFDDKCAEEFGKLRGVLKRLGISGNPVDLMIASVAVVHNLTMVTNNTADFRHVPGLRLEDWLSA